MKDDYLWDKTGEPDTEIQHLERVLGQLRSKSKAEDMMPAFENLTRTRPRPLRKALLIAASIAFALLALGAFASLQRQTTRQEANDNSIAMVSPIQSETTGTQNEAAPSGIDETKRQESDRVPPYDVSTAEPKRSNPYVPRRRVMNRGSIIAVNQRERVEGLMAKEQLIKALEITSSKLNVVQKKVQGAAPLGPSS
ncbi:MAG: hypothetical protein LC731_01970 [Acidobacteria bacterium]|nr:hypothetical protein [Acidobacteriota bacterium]